MFFIEFNELKRVAFIIFNDCNLWKQTEVYQEITTLFNKTAKVYLDGTHCTCEALSFYDRIYEKSNQPLENYNRFKNRKAREAANSNWNQKRTGKLFHLPRLFFLFYF